MGRWFRETEPLSSDAARNITLTPDPKSDLDPYPDPHLDLNFDPNSDPDPHLDPDGRLVLMSGKTLEGNLKSKDVQTSTDRSSVGQGSGVRGQCDTPVVTEILNKCVSVNVFSLL